MKWILILMVVFLTPSLQATTLRFCQESQNEAPMLNAFDIAGKTYHGAHAATAAHAMSSLGLSFTIERLPWQRCMHQAQLGKFDGVIGIGWTKERGEVFDFPGESVAQPDTALSIAQADYHIYVKAGSQLHWDGHKLTGLKFGIAAPKGYVVEQILKEHKALNELDSGLTASADLLLQQRVDGIVIADIAADNQNQLLNDHRIIKLTPAFYQQEIYMVFSHRSKLPAQQRDAIWRQALSSKILIVAGDS